MGQNVGWQLCVSAIDAREQELFCIQRSKKGIETRCRRCIPNARKFRLDIIPAEAALGGWRPLITDEHVKLLEGKSTIS